MSKPRYCEACGEALGATTRFCPGCGRPVGAAGVAPPPAPAAVITCPQCGEVKPQPRAGCAHCGHIDMRYVGQGHGGPPAVTAPSPRPAVVAPPSVAPKPLPRAVSWLIGIGALLAVFACYRFVTAAPPQSATPTALPFRAVATSAPAPTRAPLSTAITYSVTGTGGVFQASLTYENEQGGTEQADVSLPWTKSFSVKPGSFIYISAQNTSRVAGGIACDITANGRAFKHSESSGLSVIASCDGSAP